MDFPPWSRFNLSAFRISSRRYDIELSTSLEYYVVPLMIRLGQSFGPNKVTQNHHDLFEMKKVRASEESQMGTISYELPHLDCVQFVR